MTRTSVERGPETDAILALLNGAGVLTGDAERPTGGGFPGGDTTAAFVPYAVLYPGVTTDIDGPVSDPDADVTAEYQVTSVGVTRAQAAFISDKAKHALHEQDLVVPGRFVQLVEWTTGREVERDDSVTPPLFYAVDIYSVSTSPDA